MGKDGRRQLMESIERKRNSKIICYITSDRPSLPAQIAGDVVSILHEHIIRILPEDRNKLDLFIYSRGGDSDVPWSVVSMFREYCQEGSFSVLIPYRAHSGATVIALGADEIVMTKKAELGPIDITIGRGPYNPTRGAEQQSLPVSVEDVMGYFSLLKKVGCERPDETMTGFECLTRKVHPLVLGTVSRLLEQTQLVALRLLSTRANAFTEDKNREIVKRLSSEIFSHRHTISRTEAITNLGLDQVVSTEKAEIDDEMWALFVEYRDLFQFDDPFRPDDYLINNQLDEYCWTNLPIACVESTSRLDVAKQDVRVRRVPMIPPQVQLNVNIQNLPQINIQNLPPNQPLAMLIQQIFETTMKPIIDHAASKAAEAFIKSLPLAHFERTDYNLRWESEE